MGRRRILRTCLAVFQSVMMAALLGCNQATPAGPSAAPAGAPAPIEINLDEPLLLEEPVPQEPTLTAGGADNATCLVCHANYAAESLAARHAKVEIGCTACHGDSLAHKNDENNTTPPETMFATDKIDPFCKRCHHSHDVAPSKVVTRWLKRGAASADSDGVTCTVCHGEHRMKVRTVVWDKNTGRLLQTNKQR